MIPAASRRTFLQFALASPFAQSSPAPVPQSRAAQTGATREPWFRRAIRWGQTNITERDPVQYDLAWWRAHWKRTGTQGVVVNAGGIVAYYPSKDPLHYRARDLREQDLYGEVTRAAHEDGLAVLARMDSNRAHEAFYQAHPDWFAVNDTGSPYRAGELYITCIDSPYYEEYLPGILREILSWEKPEGFTDNSWSGLGRNEICYCRHSRENFRRKTGYDLPRQKNWDDPAYRAWIQWSYERRTEVWDLNNRVTKDAGGEDCLWLGMLGGDFISQGQRFRDVKAICERSEMVMLDDQGRDNDLGFPENAEMGKRLHGLLGWEKVIPESMATYQRAPVFRKSSAVEAESRTWMYAGFAGGIQPWWHHVGAYQRDRRQFTTAIPVYEWHAANDAYLRNRTPVATVGLVYSQTNADFYGRDAAMEKVGRPYYGMMQALVRARIPYLPVHADHVARDGGKFAALVLPNVAAMTDAQVDAVKRLAASGGGLLVTGESGSLNEWGDPRGEPAFASLCGVRFTGKQHGSTGTADSWSGTDHSYLRLLPDIGREVYGPVSGEEPERSGERHPVLAGFGETDILAFGGLLQEVEAAPEATVPVTFIPDFPAYPPETSWMHTPRTSIPGLVLQDRKGSGRTAFLAADLDRRYAHDNLPDHGNLLANLVRWVTRDRVPLRVEGAGLVDCHLYRQESRLILHLVNWTSAGTWRSPAEELIAVGPLTVRLALPAGVTARGARLLVGGRSAPMEREGAWARVTVERILDHEVLVLE